MVADNDQPAAHTMNDCLYHIQRDIATRLSRTYHAARYTPGVWYTTPRVVQTIVNGKRQVEAHEYTSECDAAMDTRAFGVKSLHDDDSCGRPQNAMKHLRLFASEGLYLSRETV